MCNLLINDYYTAAYRVYVVCSVCVCVFVMVAVGLLFAGSIKTES